MSARLCAEADVLCGLGEFSGVWALDGTTFQASDTEENRVEWPYASGPKSGCGFPDEITVRAVKRRPKPYPLLTKPRSEYRQEEVI